MSASRGRARASASACTTSSPPPAAAGRASASAAARARAPARPPAAARRARARARAPRTAPRFEGGQMPIHMRMRKLRGPHMKKSMPFEPFRTHTQPVNLADLEARFDAGAEVTLEALTRPRAWRTRKDVPVKVLAKGELTKALTVHAHGFSAPPRASAIEAAGGPAEIARRRARASGGSRRHALDDPQRLHGRGHPQEARLHGGCCSRSTGSARTSRCRASTSQAVNDIQKQFGGVEHPRPAEPLLAAAACRGSRSSRWGSCPTSRPRSSCSCCRSSCPRWRSSPRKARSGRRGSRSTRAT